MTEKPMDLRFSLSSLKGSLVIQLNWICLSFSTDEFTLYLKHVWVFANLATQGSTVVLSTKRKLWNQSGTDLLYVEIYNFHIVFTLLPDHQDTYSQTHSDSGSSTYIIPYLLKFALFLAFSGLLDTSNSFQAGQG